MQSFDKKPYPIDTTKIPRFAGLSTFMRLPYFESVKGLDIALLGVPFDLGTTNRPGTRHGPRQVREMSSFIRKMNPKSFIAPFDICNVADCGDAPINPMNLEDSLKRIENFYNSVAKENVMPLSCGGDHLMTLPILRGLKQKEPFGLIQFDAHSDTFDSFFGEKYTHGTGFRHAIEEGIIDPKRMVQIGLRGAIYTQDDMGFAKDAGVRMIDIDEFCDLGPQGVIEVIRSVVKDSPTYLSFDVDALDPTFAPGTGTPEVGGISTREAITILRGLRGINYIGGDVVEVSPPFDPSGNTALVGATLMFEILCLLAESRSQRK
jgi:guanidinopropionase